MSKLATAEPDLFASELASSEVWNALARLPLFAGATDGTPPTPAAPLPGLAMHDDLSPWGLDDELDGQGQDARMLMAKVELWTSAPPLPPVDAPTTAAHDLRQEDVTQPTMPAANVQSNAVAAVVTSARFDGWALASSAASLERQTRRRQGLVLALAWLCCALGASLLGLFAWVQLH